MQAKDIASNNYQSIEIAEFILDHLKNTYMHALKLKELESFKDSYAANHTVDNVVHAIKNYLFSFDQRYDDEIAIYDQVHETDLEPQTVELDPHIPNTNQVKQQPLHTQQSQTQSVKFQKQVKQISSIKKITGMMRQSSSNTKISIQRNGSQKSLNDGASSASSSKKNKDLKLSKFNNDQAIEE